MPVNKIPSEYPSAKSAIWAIHYTMRSNREIKRIVMHITQGPDAAGAASWFQNPISKVSAHFVIDRNGDVIQCVRLANIAWHAGKAGNADSIGIEHAAMFTDTINLPVTPEQYSSSAELCLWLGKRYNISLDRTTIIGHNEADKNTTHVGCPTIAFDWDKFIAVLNSKGE